ncbi:hypothetical protein J2Y46_000955 [Microbacterium sp. BE35]|uniref:hypothetical protein n=1 Tax=Microbacterium sp. BE35 TaxID=2817773 RepID=UPI0028656E93|nr:hypothetical protein [Microbacterium sp. BE35]MDR7188139.1 hypothetical protein [Microbacterium sp. BE35]
MTGAAPITESDDIVSSALKTHRYLRLSLVFLIATLFVGVIVASWDPLDLDWQVLPSISHYFYTPVRLIFVSVLVAASLALLALSGRRRPSTFLDIAAIFAPLIAIIPTGLEPPAEKVERDRMTCVATNCIPTAELASLRATVATYVVAVIMVVVTLYFIRKRKHVATSTAHRVVSWVAVITAVGLAALAFLPEVGDGFPFRFWPVDTVHFAAVLLFFGSFAAVPIIYGWRPPEPDETPPTGWQKGVYRFVAIAMGADLLFLVFVFVARKFNWDLFGEAPVVLIGEAVALFLFAWFWWEQTFQRWDDQFNPFVVTASTALGAITPAEEPAEAE